MPTTITAFYTFVGGDTALASEVSTNFTNFRGDRLPIEENTGLASDLIHDLGTINHKFSNGYISRFFFSDVTTSGLLIDGGISGTSLDIHVGGNTVSSFRSYGLPIGSETPRGYTNTSASNGNFINGTSCGYFAITIGTHASLSGEETITAWNSQINTVKKGPIRILMNSDGSTTTSGRVFVSISCNAQLICTRNGTTIGAMNLASSNYFTNVFPVSYLEFTDFVEASTSLTYSFYIRYSLANTLSVISIQYSKPIIYEIS